ncbi:unnamed protein product [Merluccius merluccius]
MATGGFKPNATTDFLEEWKAKREKMRAKMLGDIAAATGACAGNAAAATGAPSGAPMGVANTNTNGNKSGPSAELHHHNNNNNGNPGSSCPPIARSLSSSALKKGPEEEGHPAGGHLKKTLEKEREKEKCAPCAPCASLDSSPSAGLDSDPMESPSPAKGKEKRGAGPSARKGKGQIEKRKLREKRRSTGVVSLPSNESLDELEDDDGGERERKMEQQLVQANTVQNEGMTPVPGPPGPPAHLPQPHPELSCKCCPNHFHSPSGTGSAEEDVGGNARQQPPRQPRETNAYGSLDKRMEELEKELARERQENDRLLKAHEDKDDLIVKLKEEIDLLNRDLDDIEDENDQLKQENKTLLKVVGQLTR